MSDLQKGNLITSVDVSATNVKRNKPVLVKVKLAATAAKAYVRINGQSGLTRYVQFPRKGKQKVSVYVQLGKVYDEREVEVTVAELAANERHTPHVLVRRDPLETYAAWLSVANAKRFSSPNRQFKWTLSDGRTLTTRDQEIKVSFKDVIDHTKPFTEFTVDVHDVSDPAKSKGQQIVRVWSHYYMLKETKRKAMPTAVALKPVVGAGGNVDLKVEVKNVETQALNFNQLILEFMRGGNVNQPAEKPVAISFVVPAKAKATFSYTVAKSMIPADAIGVAINLIGPAAGALPELHAAAFAELPNAPVEAYAVKDPVLLNQIKALAAGNATTITLDKLNTDLLRSVKKPGALEKITIRQMALSPSGATEATSVIGQPCQPTDAAPAGVYCALTEEMEWVWTPAMIMNARKGDVILSAGGPSGVVGGVLSNVTPAQQYSHSGIMTQNYTEVRHSTASEDYLIDKLQAENLTSNNGFNPFHLKYMWPGTITQTVTDAFFGQDFVGPDGNGKTYRLTGFQHNSNFDTELNIVPPMVVKPSPVLEQPGNWIRPLLHAIAESAKQINGHYRLYAYTDAAISIKPEFNAPALTPSGKTWWGANTVATVCSSLVWTAIQRLNWTKMGIEGKPGFLKFSDLEPQENNVAMVDAQTRDGLYLYTKAERYAAAKWLRDKIHEIVDEMASEKATDEGGAIFTWLADNKDEIAFQVLNTFALDKTDRVNGDTPSWYKNQDPNVGRAVSPDDIMRFWDAPHAGPDNTIIGLYGHAEQLVLRPAQWQLRKVHR